MTHKEMLRALERDGWRFERYSRTRKRWVRITGNSRRFQVAIAYTYRAEYEARQATA